MATQTPDANQVLMGGGGAPAAKFANPGDSLKGRVTAPPQAYQEREYDKNNPGGGDPKFFPSGDPIMAVYVDVATDLRDPSIEDDDGTRRLYIEGRYLKDAIKGAIRAAGAPGLEVGGVIEVVFSHREDPEDKRSRKFWQVTYTPAGNTTLMGDDPATAAAAPPTVEPGQQATTAAPAPAAAPAGAGDTPADKAKQLLALGLDDATIAGATGLDASVVTLLRNAA